MDMNLFKKILSRSLVFTLFILLTACGGGDSNDNPPPNPPPPPPPVTPANDFWTETAVRKVLQIFAYGGHATDAQITTWAGMVPSDAIKQMLTFDEVNPLLSPSTDTTAANGGTLQALQAHWSSADASNPVREDQDAGGRDFRDYYPTLDPVTKRLSAINLQRTWIASINRRGLNPFRQKVGLFLTNYHMAVSLHSVTPPLIRRMYDDVMNDLALGKPFQEVLARGASSAAVSLQYGHLYNTYIDGIFRGNDDFAREFHQLFFRILGEDYDQDYHENTTIEQTARLLTGMNIDREVNAWGSTNLNDYWLDFIDFTDHTDANDPPRILNNTLNHHAADLEILGKRISGTTALDKINALVQVAINERESLDRMPEFIINFFADDNLNNEKLIEIRKLWQNINLNPKSLLSFLQEYAISPTFHRDDTYKYRTAFSRNLALFNLNTVDNEEAYKNSWTPVYLMNQQGATAFAPAHDVFGGQTSLNAANNPDIFKTAYNNAVDNYWFSVKYTEAYTDSTGAQTWLKDWARVVPDTSGVYVVDDVGEWLWQRLISDNLKNYGPLERAYVNGFLATGNDLGFIFDEAAPEEKFTPAQLDTQPYISYLTANKTSIMNLDSSNANLRIVANRNMGLAVNFISMTPFMFAIEAN